MVGYRLFVWLYGVGAAIGEIVEKRRRAFFERGIPAVFRCEEISPAPHQVGRHVPVFGVYDTADGIFAVREFRLTVGRGERPRNQRPGPHEQFGGGFFQRVHRLLRPGWIRHIDWDVRIVQ